jgi:FtsZ-binding cell division protein ZapB
MKRINEELNSCVLDFDNKKKLSSELNILISQADILIGRLENISSQVQGFINESKDDFARLGVSLDSVLSFSINVEPLKTKKDSLVKETKQIDESLDPQKPGSIGNKILNIKSTRKQLENKLDQPNRLYQQYKTDLMNWESKRSSILGRINTNTLKFYERDPELNLYLGNFRRS